MAATCETGGRELSGQGKEIAAGSPSGYRDQPHRSAGRASYFAAYHSAQALIFDRSGKVAKTHSGVRSEFSRLIKDDPAIDREFSVFLGQAYMFKVIADYEIETGGVLPRERVQEAITTAARFIDHITALVQPPTAPTPETTSDPAA